MSTVEIKLTGDVLGAFNRLLAANADLGLAWRAIGNLLEESTKRRFGPGIGPDGRRWLPNSPVTLQAMLARRSGSFKKRDGKLSAEGMAAVMAKKPLIGELGALSDKFAYEVLPDGVRVGSIMEYAAMQQFGGTRAQFPNLWGDIPARPFLGISDEDQFDMFEILQEHLLGSL